MESVSENGLSVGEKNLDWGVEDILGCNLNLGYTGKKSSVFMINRDTTLY